MKTYSKVIGSPAEIALLAKQAKEEGLKEAENIPNIPVGSHIGEIARDDKNTPLAFFIPYDRVKDNKKEKRFFKGLICNTVHESTGKSFANVYVGMNDDEYEEFGNESFAGSLYLECTEYPKPDGTKGKAVKIAN